MKKVCLRSYPEKILSPTDEKSQSNDVDVDGNFKIDNFNKQREQKGRSEVCDARREMSGGGVGGGWGETGRGGGGVVNDEWGAKMTCTSTARREERTERTNPVCECCIRYELSALIASPA
ncbi:hypothetical protein J6590_097199 [Homalodisca vitripennis]|nr:hypothetical protein J6590_097199 [Homalodisca vitripennis]